MPGGTGGLLTKRSGWVRYDSDAGGAPVSTGIRRAAPLTDGVVVDDLIGGHARARIERRIVVYLALHPAGGDSLPSCPRVLTSWKRTGIKYSLAARQVWFAQCARDIRQWLRHSGQRPDQDGFVPGARNTDRDIGDRRSPALRRSYERLAAGAVAIGLTLLHYACAGGAAHPNRAETVRGIYS
jgi:hypothetical protein